MTLYYKDVHKMFIATAIAFNHESPLRSTDFVTRKLTRGVARIKLGLQEKLSVGNLYAIRDWGHAEDYVRAMWMMLNKTDEADEFIICTEKNAQIRDWVEQTFREAGY